MSAPLRRRQVGGTAAGSASLVAAGPAMAAAAGDDWRRHGRRMARRVGCCAACCSLVLGGAGAALIWLLLSAIGAVGSAPFARVVSGGGAVLGIAAVIAAGVALRRLTAPAARLVEAARRIEAGDYSARVPVRGPSELRSLARAFNAMSGRLEADEARRRSVLADVAHELRTPITVIRGQAEGIIDGVYPADAEHMRPVLTATRTLEVLVDDLRTLALAETGSLRLHREPVELAILVDEAFATFTDAAGGRACGSSPPSIRRGSPSTPTACACAARSPTSSATRCATSTPAVRCASRRGSPATLRSGGARRR